MPAATDVAGIGNAIVDVIAHADDAFLAAQGFAKGAMTLIDTGRAETLYAAMGPAVESSGGSAGNTMAGIASLGGRPAFIGKTRDDLLGQVYRHDMTAIGVRFDTPSAPNGTPTGRCLIMVTPDGQRTMGTLLGISAELGPDDIDPELIAAAEITYLEGYLFDPPPAQAAFRKAAKIAHGAGRRVALSLSDPFCVGRHRDAFRQLVAGEVDILFANEAEICALYERNTLDEAAAHARQDVALAVLTRSEDGSLVLQGGEAIEVPAVPTTLVDSTGAGDAYAAGFLAALGAGRSLAQCGAWGSIAAAEVISHFGARPQRDLKPEVLALR
jgi:sugar/nucleoside kinase (ribokinase family)